MCLFLPCRPRRRDGVGGFKQKAYDVRRTMMNSKVAMGQVGGNGDSEEDVYNLGGATIDKKARILSNTLSGTALFSAPVTE